MKKYLIGFIVGAVIFVPATAFGAGAIELPWTNNIYRVSKRAGGSNTVSVFDDGEYKCYVLSSNGYYNSGANSISCVKRD